MLLAELVDSALPFLAERDLQGFDSELEGFDLALEPGISGLQIRGRRHFVVEYASRQPVADHLKRPARSVRSTPSLPDFGQSLDVRDSHAQVVFGAASATRQHGLSLVPCRVLLESLDGLAGLGDFAVEFPLDFAGSGCGVRVLCLVLLCSPKLLAVLVVGGPELVFEALVFLLQTSDFLLGLLKMPANRLLVEISVSKACNSGTIGSLPSFSFTFLASGVASTKSVLAPE